MKNLFDWIGLRLGNIIANPGERDGDGDGGGDGDGDGDGEDGSGAGRSYDAGDTDDVDNNKADNEEIIKGHNGHNWQRPSKVTLLITKLEEDEDSLTRNDVTMILRVQR